MARRYSDNDIAFGHMSFLDVLANSVGALTFLFLMFFVITSALVAPAKFQLLTTSLPKATVGANYNVAMAAVGGTAPYKWSIAEGFLPAGMALDRKTGVISGSSTGDGRFNFKIKVTDSNKSRRIALTKDLGLRIEPQAVAQQTGGMALQLKTDKLPNATVGAAYNVTLAAVGGTPPYSWSIAGQLPPGLTLKEDQLSGVPQAKGDWPFQIKVDDRQAASSAQNVAVTIDPKPLLTEADVKPVTVITKELPPARVDEPYNLTLAAGGGVPPYRWSVGGRLARGLTLDPKTGVISGIPEQATVSDFALAVTDSRGGEQAKKDISIEIGPAQTTLRQDSLPFAWWVIVIATLGTVLGLILLAGIVIGVQCPWDKSWGCKAVGEDSEGHTIYECKHGHRFVNDVRQVAKEAVV